MNDLMNAQRRYLEERRQKIVFCTKKERGKSDAFRLLTMRESSEISRGRKIRRRKDSKEKLTPGRSDAGYTESYVNEKTVRPASLLLP